MMLRQVIDAIAVGPDEPRRRLLALLVGVRKPSWTLQPHGEWPTVAFGARIPSRRDSRAMLCYHRTVRCTLLLF